MPITIRSARVADAEDIGRLARQFARYLRCLGDQTKFNMIAEAYVRDGFGKQSAFSGFVAEDGDKVIGYLLYHLGYDSDAAARILHVVDLYVEQDARRRGVGEVHAAGAGANDDDIEVFGHTEVSRAIHKRLRRIFCQDERQRQLQELA